MEWADLQFEPAGVEARDACFDEQTGSHLLPVGERSRTRELEAPQAVLLPAQRELERVADRRRRLETGRGDQALLTRSEVDKHVTPVHTHHGSANPTEGVGAVGRRVAFGAGRHGAGARQRGCAPRVGAPGAPRKPGDTGRAGGRGGTLGAGTVPGAGTRLGSHGQHLRGPASLRGPADSAAGGFAGLRAAPR